MKRPTLILLVGIPGSGKTTYAKQYVDKEPMVVHLSSDSIRKELYGDESIQGNPSEVFSLMQQRAVGALNDGMDVLYDATNVTRKDRSSIIGICPRFAKIECHIIWAPIEECIIHDANRDRTVGKEVIDRMLKRFQAPYYDEGIDEIKVIKPKDFDEVRYIATCMNNMKIPHDNPHHTLSVYDHCIEASHIIGDVSHDPLYAAAIHDVGKPYVKSFTDSKGNPCEVAHYYQHQCVGAWLSYGLDVIAIPKIAWLISTHMDPFLNTKYYHNLPLCLKRDIDILHKADLESH